MNLLIFFFFSMTEFFLLVKCLNTSMTKHSGNAQHRPSELQSQGLTKFTLQNNDTDFRRLA